MMIIVMLILKLMRIGSDLLCQQGPLRPELAVGRADDQLPQGAS